MAFCVYSLSMLVCLFVCACRPSVQNNSTGFWPTGSLMTMWPISRAKKQPDSVLHSLIHNEHSSKSLTGKLLEKSGLRGPLFPDGPVTHLIVFNWLLHKQHCSKNKDITINTDVAVTSGSKYEFWIGCNLSSLFINPLIVSSIKC